MNRVNPEIEKAADWIKESDGLIIIGANGVSMADGFAILRPSQWFMENFHDFYQKYGIQTPLQGFQYPFRDPQEYNEFYSRLLKKIHYDKPLSSILKLIKDLYDLKPSFVVTTNVEDRFSQAGIDESRLFYMEGRADYRKDHTYIEEKDLPSITDGSMLETHDYAGSDHFNDKVQDLNVFLNEHPDFVIVEMGVSANNYFLRPLILQMLEHFNQSRLIVMNLASNPVYPQYASRTLQLTGPLEENLEQLITDVKK